MLRMTKKQLLDRSLLIEDILNNLNVGDSVDINDPNIPSFRVCFKREKDKAFPSKEFQMKTLDDSAIMIRRV